MTPEQKEYYQALADAEPREPEKVWTEWDQADHDNKVERDLE